MSAIEQSSPDLAQRATTPTSIVAADGMRLECRYLLSPHYDPSSNICLSLHWLFLLYCPDRSYTGSYLLRSAIEHFLDYMAKHNANNPSALHIRKYTDINSETFTGYDNYLRDEGVPPSTAEKLKTAISVVAKTTGKLPMISLPIVKINKKPGQEPLSGEGFDSLEYALTQHTTKLWNKLKFREEVEKAEPYTAAEVMDTVRPTPTKERLIQWIRSKPTQACKYKASRLDSMFSRCPDPEISALAGKPKALSNFKCIVKRDEHLYVTSTPATDPFEKTGFAAWEVDYARVVKTFLVHGFPFKLNLRAQAEIYSQSKVVTVDDDCDDIIRIILHRLTWGNRAPTNRLLMFDEVMGLYFPTLVDMTALLMLMMFQSGWNKETALALDQDNYEHVLTGTIEAAIKVVYSEKNRSQGVGKPFEAPKRINLPTRDDDPYSFYSLIKLARLLSEPLATYPFDVVPALSSEDKMNPLFLCMRPWGDWLKGGRHTSIAHPKTFQIAVQQFLRQYEVTDNGKRLTTASELTRRLRPTWLLYKKKHNPIALLSMSMGHADRDTTDIFYDNSGAAHQERMKRLRSELEEVIKLLRMRQFKGLLGKMAQAEASVFLKVFHIPGQTRALWGCANQRKPDWVGSELIASTGGKCYEIKECIFCSRMRIFEDSLPYLIEREAHLAELLEGEDDTGFRSRIVSEREALQFILDEWGDEDEVIAAAQYRRYSNAPLLPRDLGILKIIFESEDYNV